MDKDLIIRILKEIHAIGGWDSSEPFYRGWNSAIINCEDIITKLTGVKLENIDGKAE